ncbi:MAG: hypothetical protein ACT4P5_04925, partial [Armatimonadota bacterium]
DPGQLVTSVTIHNTVLQSWVAGGVVTFVGVALLYWRTLRLTVGAVVGYANGRGAWEILGLSASIIGWLLIDMVQPHIYHRYTWLTVALLYGLTRQSRDSREASRSGPLAGGSAIASHG